MVCSPIPPAPGCQNGPEGCVRSPANSCHDLAPSVVLNIAASSAPAYTVSGSVSDGSKCQIRLNSQGCGVASYHRCVPVAPSYANLLSITVQVFPPSSERWMIWPCHPEDCDA